ncbi:MAG: biotin/lipoyl-binding protein, partial [Nitrospirae bacterium]|nr:biotin/lipoyl-binding protein [Nitrospirota bacterium]
MINLHTIENRLKELDKKVLFAGIAIITLAVIAGIGYRILGKQGGPAGAPSSGESIAVPVVMAEPRIVESVVTAAGALNSKNSSMLSGKVMGRVVALNVHEGDQVAEGRLLMKIESGEITAQVIQAQAAYNNAKLQYDRIKSLYDAQASTQMEMDQATLGFETAQ